MSTILDTASAAVLLIAGGLTYALARQLFTFPLR